MGATDLRINDEATIIRKKFMESDSIVPMPIMDLNNYANKERGASEVKVEIGGVEMMARTMR